MSSFSSDRDSRFEALRLIGIYFIILTHASAFGIRIFSMLFLLLSLVISALFEMSPTKGFLCWPSSCASTRGLWRYWLY